MYVFSTLSNICRYAYVCTRVRRVQTMHVIMMVVCRLAGKPKSDIRARVRFVRILSVRDDCDGTAEHCW